MKHALIADQLSPPILPLHTSVSTARSFVHTFLISEQPQIEQLTCVPTLIRFFESHLSALLSDFRSSHLAPPSEYYDDRTDVALQNLTDHELSTFDDCLVAQQ